MSAFIGTVKTPHHDASVWASRGGVELTLADVERRSVTEATFSPVSARNLAALLVRASEEVERIRARPWAQLIDDGSTARNAGFDEYIERMRAPLVDDGSTTGLGVEGPEPDDSSENADAPVPGVDP